MCAGVANIVDQQAMHFLYKWSVLFTFCVSVYNWQSRYVVRLSDFGNLVTVNADALLPSKPGLFDDAAPQVS